MEDSGGTGTGARVSYIKMRREMKRLCRFDRCCPSYVSVRLRISVDYAAHELPLCEVRGGYGCCQGMHNALLSQLQP